MATLDEQRRCLKLRGRCRQTRERRAGYPNRDIRAQMCHKVLPREIGVRQRVEGEPNEAGALDRRCGDHDETVGRNGDVTLSRANCNDPTTVGDQSSRGNSGRSDASVHRHFRVVRRAAHSVSGAVMVLNLLNGRSPSGDTLYRQRRFASRGPARPRACVRRLNMQLQIGEVDSFGNGARRYPVMS